MSIKLLIVISNISIYKTYEIIKNKKVQVTHFFLLKKKKKRENFSFFFFKKKKKTYCHILIWGLSLLKAFGHGLNGLGLGPALKGRWILYPK